MNYGINVNGVFSNYWLQQNSNTYSTKQKRFYIGIGDSQELLYDDVDNFQRIDEKDNIPLVNHHIINKNQVKSAHEMTTCIPFFVPHSKIKNNNITGDLKISTNSLEKKTLQGQKTIKESYRKNTLKKYFFFKGTSSFTGTVNESFTTTNVLLNVNNISIEPLESGRNNSFSTKATQKGKLQIVYNKTVPNVHILRPFSNSSTFNLTNKGNNSELDLKNNTIVSKTFFGKIFSIKLKNNVETGRNLEDQPQHNESIISSSDNVQEKNTESNNDYLTVINDSETQHFPISTLKKRKFMDLLSFHVTLPKSNVINTFIDPGGTNITDKQNYFDTSRYVEIKSADTYLHNQREYASTQSYFDNYTFFQPSISKAATIKLHFKDILNFGKPTINDETTKPKPKIIYALLKGNDSMDLNLKSNLLVGKLLLNNVTAPFKKHFLTSTDVFNSGHAVSPELISTTTNLMETQVFPTPILQKPHGNSPTVSNIQSRHYLHISTPKSVLDIFNFKKPKFNYNIPTIPQTILNSPAENNCSTFDLIHHSDEILAASSPQENAYLEKEIVQSNTTKSRNNFHVKNIFNFNKMASPNLLASFNPLYSIRNGTLSNLNTNEYASFQTILNSDFHCSNKVNPQISIGNYKKQFRVFKNGNRSGTSSYNYNVTSCTNYKPFSKNSKDSFTEEEPSLDKWLFEMQQHDVRIPDDTSRQGIQEENIFKWYFKTTLDQTNLSNSYSSYKLSKSDGQKYSNQVTILNQQSNISRNSFDLMKNNNINTCITQSLMEDEVTTNFINGNDVSTAHSYTVSQDGNLSEHQTNIYDRIKYGILPRKLLPQLQNYSSNRKTEKQSLDVDTTAANMEEIISELDVSDKILTTHTTTQEASKLFRLHSDYEDYLSAKKYGKSFIKHKTNKTVSMNATANGTSFHIMPYVMKPVDSLMNIFRGISSSNLTKLSSLSMTGIGNGSLPKQLLGSNASLLIPDIYNSSSEIHESKISLLELFGGWFHCPLESYVEPAVQDVHFYLYTRNNKHNPEELILASLVTPPDNDTDTPEPVLEREFNTSIQTVKKRQISDDENFEPLNPAKTDIQSKWFNILSETKVLVHGYLQDHQTDIIVNMKDAFLKKGDVNVIVMDWSVIGDNTCYPLVATKSLQNVGQMLAWLLDHLVEGGLSLNHVHMVGFSLGAHVLGHAGTLIHHGLAGRITGLDPALPYVRMDADSSLDSGDAVFVDIIHTASGYLGQTGPMGHVDFYPNGGFQQPGCDFSSWPLLVRALLSEVVAAMVGCALPLSTIVLLLVGTCSHRRAALYFIESITSDVGFQATACDSWHNFLAGHCNQSRHIPMGDSCPSNESGTFFLVTGQKEPFSQLPEEHLKVKKSLLFDLFYDFDDL